MSAAPFKANADRRHHIPKQQDAMRRFVDIDLGHEPVPDETTVCRFRHLLETHDLGQQLFDEVQRHLAAKGLKVAAGTIVDATIISAPSSTKNAEKARDPEMHQTKKGNQWYFGMKAHLGVDSRTKLIHAVVATPANVADSTVLPELLLRQRRRLVSMWLVEEGASDRHTHETLRANSAAESGGYHVSGKAWQTGLDWGP
jgi:hypothetical protein